MPSNAIYAEVVPAHTGCDQALLAAVGFLAGYRGRSLETYQRDLRGWWAWCDAGGLAVLDVRRLHIELYVRHLEAKGYAPATVCRRLSTVVCFYRYCEAEEIVDRSPARFLRRPKVSLESTTLGLDRAELAAFLAAALAAGPAHHAVACLLGLNGLRVSEACQADIEGLGVERGHRTLRIIGKGAKPATIPLAPRTWRAVDLIVGGRDGGPILLDRRGRRPTRQIAGYMIRGVARSAGITKRISPHSLRHSFVTAALDAGVPLRDVQTAARHASPATTNRYDRHRHDLDRHAAYAVSEFIDGAA